MGLLVDGHWKTDWYKNDASGHFRRPDTQVRGRISAEPSAEHPPAASRYHLVVSLACPWAHRTLITRAVKGLDEAVTVSVVQPYMGDNGWQFGEHETYDAEHGTRDHLFGFAFLRELYVKSDSHYSGRVTVPVLWDREKAMVNNESREIVAMLDTEMNPFAKTSFTLRPRDRIDAIEKVCDEIYEPINNGVYKAGFASSQSAYDEAVGELFEALDRWDRVLAKQRYLCGEVVTAADVHMFTTLYRFDPVYSVHFKCHLRRIRDYEHLWPYLRDLYQIPAFARDCQLHHIKQHYYRSHPSINPKRIVPAGPDLALDAPHDRAKLSAWPGGQPFAQHE